MRGFQRLENGDVQITLSPADWDRLLITLGVAASVPSWQRATLELVKRINQGNPDFAAYGFEDAGGAA